MFERASFFRGKALTVNGAWATNAAMDAKKGKIPRVVPRITTNRLAAAVDQFLASDDAKGQMVSAITGVIPSRTRRAHRA